MQIGGGGPIQRAFAILKARNYEGLKYGRRKRQPTSVLLPGESQERGSLVGCHLWGRTELDTTEVT